MAIYMRECRPAFMTLIVAKTDGSYPCSAQARSQCNMRLLDWHAMESGILITRLKVVLVKNAAFASEGGYFAPKPVRTTFIV